MKKAFAWLLCALLLLPVFAGCASREDQALPSLSDKKKEQIAKDFLVYIEFPKEDVTIEEFWEVPWLQYLGSYNGYDVFLDPFYGRMATQAVCGIRIAGQDFAYHHGFNLIAYKDGAFQYLEEVYEAGGISEEQIKEIAACHRRRYEHHTGW